MHLYYISAAVFNGQKHFWRALSQTRPSVRHQNNQGAKRIKMTHPSRGRRAAWWRSSRRTAPGRWGCADRGLPSGSTSNWPRRWSATRWSNTCTPSFSAINQKQSERREWEKVISVMAYSDRFESQRACGTVRASAISPLGCNFISRIAPGIQTLVMRLITFNIWLHNPREI